METNVIIEILTEQHELLKKIAKGQNNSGQPAIPPNAIGDIKFTASQNGSKLDDVIKDSHRQRSDHKAIYDRVGQVYMELTKKRDVQRVEKSVTLDIRSTSTFALVMGLVTAVIFLGFTCLVLLTPRNQNSDDALKYRYIKMKGGATGKSLAELEDIFELNRNIGKIRQIRKDIETFEEAVEKKALLDEQNRLKALESAALAAKAKAIKSGK